MRIISGEFRSRRLHTPPDDAVTRPIPDRVKESLFSMLRGHCEGANVFDGFAGTGALGLEAVSRGAARCVCVEQDKGVAATVLSRNVEMLGVADRCEVVVGDALGPGALARAPRPLTIAFLDPPYPLVQDVIGMRRVLAQMGKLVELLAPDGIAVLRTPYPLRHVAGGGGGAGPVPAAAPARRPKGKYKDQKAARKWRGGVDADDETLTYPGMEEEVDAAEVLDRAQQGTIAGAPTGVSPGSGVTYVEVDLILPNAAGPESHVYHNMAVHLYMKKKPVASPA